MTNLMGGLASALLIYMIYKYMCIYIWLNFEKDGSLDFRLKIGAACFQAIGAVWELGGAASRHACVDSRGSELWSSCQLALVRAKQS